MDRRKFLSWMSVGAIASSFPIALAACNGDSQTTTEAETPASPTVEAEMAESPPETASTDLAEEGFVNVGTVDQLENEGFILDKDAATPFIALRNPDTQEIIALNPTCTHKGCIVDYDGAAQAFACPCHGAKYDATGAVTNGPAEDPLSVLESREEGDAIFVKIS
ncbi:MAG: ubiquinol-cytochrome c reductase iron-sulfur subunit [Spirulinaceae cyanobacterium]